MTKKKKTEDTSSTVENFFADAAEQQQARFEAVGEEWEKWEKRSADQAEHVVDEMARLMKSSVDYSLEMQREMRRQFMENTRKAFSLMSR